MYTGCQLFLTLVAAGVRRLSLRSTRVTISATWACLRWRDSRPSSRRLLRRLEGDRAYRGKKEDSVLTGAKFAGVKPRPVAGRWPGLRNGRPVGPPDQRRCEGKLSQNYFARKSCRHIFDMGDFDFSECVLMAFSTSFGVRSDF